ncbi:peroxiredoxin DOT5 [Staphylotrichum tortipilum]|uniref:thioredoxin-dependent peroxiredoxin n=1 Tax=Staphylotrichum tortipilum TaxID=2831512 RepID=A0AAN6MRA1_9PEZI|nr:peroxiredoxin DOT5 [Staphylotrichum longicolle]
MPMELRKRKAAPAPPPPAPAAKKQAKAAKPAPKPKAAAPVKEDKPAAAATNGSPAAPAVGDTITLDGFGGEIETNDGAKTTLKALVDASKAGVVLFTYPKASTPGCTRQVCLFRDSYDALTKASGLTVYGLSTDSPKANTTFKEKQRLPYPLLCDTAATLIAAIGLKKAPKGTTRGVFVVSKDGKVLAAQPGGPEKTVDVVKALVEELEEKGEEVKEAEKEEKEDEKAEEKAESVNGEGKDDKEKEKE